MIPLLGCELSWALVISYTDIDASSKRMGGFAVLEADYKPG